MVWPPMREMQPRMRQTVALPLRNTVTLVRYSPCSLRNLILRLRSCDDMTGGRVYRFGEPGAPEGGSEGQIYDPRVGWV